MVSTNYELIQIYEAPTNLQISYPPTVEAGKSTSLQKIHNTLYKILTTKRSRPSESLPAGRLGTDDLRVEPVRLGRKCAWSRWPESSALD